MGPGDTNNTFGDRTGEFGQGQRERLILQTSGGEKWKIGRENGRERGEKKEKFCFGILI